MFSVKLKKKENNLFFSFSKISNLCFTPLCVCVCVRSGFLSSWLELKRVSLACVSLFVKSRKFRLPWKFKSRIFSLNILELISVCICASCQPRKKKKKRPIFVERKAERIHNQMLAPKSCCGTWWIEPVHLYSVSGSVCNTRLKINHSFFLSSFHYWHCTGQIQKRVTAKVKWICFLFAVRTAIKLCGTGMCWFLPHSCQIVLCKTETKHVWISWHMFTATACTFCIYTHVTNHLFD